MTIDVLMVDDEEKNLYVLESLIKEINVNCEINTLKAEGGEKALTIAIEGNVDLIILDIHMPGMNGFEVAKYLKSNKKTKDIPIIFLTASFTAEEFMKYGYQLGATDYFTKPIEKYQFLNRIKLYIEIFIKNKELIESDIIISQNVIHSKTDVKGIISEVSEAFCKISGYQRDELIGHSHNILRHPDMPESLYKDLWETILSGSTWNGEIKNLKKDGSIYWVMTTITPIFGKNNEITSFESVRYDITDKVALRELNKDLEEKVRHKVDELHSLNCQLMETAKFVQMGEMIENITHQWRQPLGVISAIVSKTQIKIQLDNLDTEVLESDMKTLQEQSVYLSSVIQTFKEFLKSHNIMETVNLQQRLKDTFVIASHVLKDNYIELIEEFEQEPISMTLPKGHLAQVIINIVNNAKDILVDKKVSNPWVKVTLENQEDKAVIAVEDNGPGIADDILPRIFDSHFTTKESHNGTGIGLHMSKKIVMESLGGKLYATNTENGAKFFIELPKG